MDRAAPRGRGLLAHAGAGGRALDRAARPSQLWPVGARRGGTWGAGLGSGPCVPFVNRPFESEIHGTVNFTQFCFFLLVTWCYRVLLSCYLRPK